MHSFDPVLSLPLPVFKEDFLLGLFKNKNGRRKDANWREVMLAVTLTIPILGIKFMNGNDASQIKQHSPVVVGGGCYLHDINTICMLLVHTYNTYIARETIGRIRPCTLRVYEKCRWYAMQVDADDTNAVSVCECKQQSFWKAFTIDRRRTIIPAPSYSPNQNITLKFTPLPSHGSNLPGSFLVRYIVSN